MASNDEENQPLLTSGSVQVSSVEESFQSQNEEPPPYRSFEDKGHELEPPPYTWSHEGPLTPTPSEGSSTGNSLIPHINCRVCQTMLSVEGKMHLHVIKCNACNEATPIRPAPPGKKYVRCPCNCLLICKVTSLRIVCPRQNCKRVITLEPVQSGVNYSAYNSRNPTRRITCGHCNAQFLCVRPGDGCDKCPHCDRLSSFGPTYRKRRIQIYLFLSIIFLIVAISINVSTLLCKYDEGKKPQSEIIGFPILWAALYLISVLLFTCSLKYSCMTVSHIERPQLQYGT